ncbi:uncharacterized protein RAG0_05154 [Rhynchosporium agropyri]|uniref:Uncharacterized protein n=1 Tax=Rhynchosporium agropyri TaxID=914238 RepID=A0A1E1KBY7_9HELO|nr:uncharacterized protein RAG0_05154 [Rhynchosporium agropyri]
MTLLSSVNIEGLPGSANRISMHSQDPESYFARATATALQIAATDNDYGITRLLLENGASVFDLDGRERTPLGRLLDGYNFCTEVPDHIGKPAQSFLEIATICRMASLYGFLKAELSWFGKRTQHTYPSATPFTSGEGNPKS